METTGDFLFRMGIQETCLGKPISREQTYFYSDGLVFEYVDNKTDLDKEEAECETYLEGYKPPPSVTDIFEDSGTAGYEIVRDVLEEIKLFRRYVLRIDKD